MKQESPAFRHGECQDVVVRNDRLYKDGYYSATEVIVEDGNIIIETDYDDMVDEL